MVTTKDAAQFEDQTAAACFVERMIRRLPGSDQERLGADRSPTMRAMTLRELASVAVLMMETAREIAHFGLDFGFEQVTQIGTLFSSNA